MYLQNAVSDNVYDVDLGGRHSLRRSLQTRRMGMEPVQFEEADVALHQQLFDHYEEQNAEQLFRNERRAWQGRRTHFSERDPFQLIGAARLTTASIKCSHIISSARMRGAISVTERQQRQRSRPVDHVRATK
ncbi:MAG: hypothetical protein R3A47_07985 [Polyangiales bacterium]